MENFLSARPSIPKLSVPPKTTANLFASLASRATHHTHPGPAVEHLAARPAVESHSHEPQVELVRENGAVQRIVVVCKCGERIELDCVY